MNTHGPHARLNSFHRHKHNALGGNNARHVPPAWRNNSASTSKRSTGSKILISNLPYDVSEQDVDELFRKTVGPLRESFVIYKGDAMSRGMAVVTFESTEHAALARSKYNGKVVDGSKSRKPIKIEIISDTTVSFSSVASQPSLMQRLADAPGKKTVPATKASTTTNHMLPRQAAAVNVATSKAARQKKGPKRLKKQTILRQQPKTREDLDAEMDSYQSQR